MKTSLPRCGGITLALYALLSAIAVRADSYGLDTAASSAGLSGSNTDIPVTIGKVVGYVLGFTGTIFFILVLYAGFMWMVAGGNEENIKKAQGILKDAIIGLIIVLSAYAITKFIGGVL